LSNITLIIGQDDYLVCEAAKKVVGDGVGLEVIDSLCSGNAEQQLSDMRKVEASVLTPPFLDPKKVTWWKNVHFLPSGGGKKGASDEVKEALVKFAKKISALDLPDNQKFLLTAPQLLKTSEFAKIFSASATVVNLAPDPYKAIKQAEARVLEYAAEIGLSFGPGLERRFVETVGLDARTQLSELAKLRDYLGEGNTLITGKDIEAVTSPGMDLDAKPWDVTNPIADRDLAKALDALRKFELENGFAIFMSGVIEGQFRRMYDDKRKMPSAHPMWTLGELRVARARFVRLRERVVSGSNCGNMLVVTELIRAMRRAAK